MKQLIVCFFLLLNTSISLQAQATSVAHREFDADDWLDGSLNMKDQGVLLFGWEEKTKFAMKALDKELRDFASWSIATEKKATLADIAYSENSGQVLVLIQTGKMEYQLTVINVKEKTKKATTLTIPKGTSLRESLYLVGGDIWFVASTKKASFMYRCNMNSPKLTPLDPHITAEKFSISSVENIGNGEVSICYFYGPKKAREMDATILKDNGTTLIKNVLGSLTSEQRTLMINASVTRLGDGDYALTGTYNKKGKGIGNGVYFARYSNSKVRYFSTFDYSDFEHFYDYLSDKRRDKIEAKIAKKKGKGKEVTINSLSIMHKTINTAKGLVFIGEYYYPTYRTETYTTTVNGRPTTQTRTVFDGYQYTHGLAVGIDDNGKKLYDLSIPLNISYKPFVAKRFLRIYSDSQTINLVHTSGRLIYSSRLTGDKIVNNEYAFITKIADNEKEKWAASSSIYWYENYYFVLESQRTKEKGLGGKKKTKYYAVKVELKE